MHCVGFDQCTLVSAESELESLWKEAWKARSAWMHTEARGGRALEEP